jgi:hypothetical protein
MKTNMKRPENIRKGFKIAGLFAVILMALCVSVGFGADNDLVYGATAVATAGGGSGAIVGQEVSTETMKGASSNILEDSVSTKITECFKDQSTLFYILDKVAKEKMNTNNGTFSRVHRFYQIGQRPVTDLVTVAYVDNVSSTPKNDRSVEIKVEKASIWTKDSVIYPQSVSGKNKLPLATGYSYESGNEKALGSLLFVVVDVNKGEGKIKVQPINGKRATAGDPETAYVPSIPAGTIFTRLAPLGSETDAQAAVYTAVPQDTFNYVATFHTQYEVTPDYLKHGKEINFGETQIKDHTLSDFMDGIEKTLLVGQRAEFTDVVDDDKKYEMGGVLYFMQNSFTYNVATSTDAGLTPEDLNNLMAAVFSGNNGSKTRIMLMGSEFARRAQLLKDTDKWSTKMTPKQVWGFEFTGISNLFGTLDALLYTQLDDLGMENCALILDLRNISLVDAEGLAVTPLDLKKSGQKNVDASYITRKLTLELRNPKTHMLVKPNFV